MKKNSLPTYCLTASLIALLPSVVSADVVNWNGGSVPPNNDFNDPDNWDGGSVPGVDDAAAFSGIGANAVLSADTTILRLLTRSQTTASVDTGGFTLTLSSVIANRARNSGLLGSDLTLIGNLSFTSSPVRFLADNASTITYDDADLSGTGSNPLSIDGNGQVILSNGSTINDFSDVTVTGDLRISGLGNEINTGLVQDGGSLTFTSAGDQVSVDSVSGSGSWVFDLASTDSDEYIAAGSLDISNITLDLSNLSPGVTALNPVILASYSGGLTGTFAGITGLGPGQEIDYNFMGTGQIAIVPEPSLYLPLMAGLFPIIGYRRRLRR